MKRPRHLDVNELPMVGGAACLDFVNTTGARASGQPRERFLVSADVQTWCRRAGFEIVMPRPSRRAPRHDESVPESALQHVLVVRELLYRVLCAVAEHRIPMRQDVERLDRLSVEDRLRRRLVIDAQGARLAVIRRSGTLDDFLFTMVDSAVTLLRSERVRLLKRCAECDWLFIDDTKNQSRTWCKKACGDRVRARRHYRARRQSAGATSLGRAAGGIDQ